MNQSIEMPLPVGSQVILLEDVDIGRAQFEELLEEAEAYEVAQ